MWILLILLLIIILCNKTEPFEDTRISQNFELSPVEKVSIQPYQVEEWRKRYPNGILLDIRGIDEIQHGTLPDAVPFNDLATRPWKVEELSYLIGNDRPILVFDRDGERSKLATKILLENCFNAWAVVDGGYENLRLIFRECNKKIPILSTQINACSL